MATAGTVREWHADEGWGVIDSDATPGGCWAHFSNVLMSGYRFLSPDQPVEFEFEAGRQDGYDYRAVAVWIGDARPAALSPQEPSAAFRSILRLNFDAPTEPVGCAWGAGTLRYERVRFGIMSSGTAASVACGALAPPRPAGT